MSRFFIKINEESFKDNLIKQIESHKDYESDELSDFYLLPENNILFYAINSGILEINLLKSKAFKAPESKSFIIPMVPPV